MKTAIDRLLNYVSYDTESDEASESCPSTAKQLVLAEQLRQELIELGATDVRMSEYGYLFARIPATSDEKVPVLGFIAHMDTSPALSGADVKPRIVQDYDGGDIVLNEEKQIVMKVADFSFLSKLKGEDLIVTDGTTLLGADDKAGIAEIMTMAEHFLTHPEIKHGEICIGFTPDEEIGRGADHFDVADFGADIAYTVDGGALGELEYENFNAASAKVVIHGASIHPGSAKLKMKNALLIGMEFQRLLPTFENPMYTEGYEGFYHLDVMNGSVEEAQMDYIIRDHDRAKFEEKKRFFADAAAFLNRKYGEGTVVCEIRDSYYNMKEKIEPCMYLIDTAEAAMRACGVEPIVVPIRGGTDGARLS
ncbi:MAG: peptidase T, partial [Oliverpabstia sp.]|nr:peptidase T [Oliverpabstia sp.]